MAFQVGPWWWNTWWGKRTAAINVTIVVAILVFVMWTALEPSSIPNWAVVAFLLVVVPMGMAVSAKRWRAERRLVRSIWHALTRTRSN
jgi:Flp pilus assembly protein protease CpaA